MFRAIALSIVFLTCDLILAQNPADTLWVPADTLFVIPAGPVAGSFTGAARLTVLDTVAGWAKIQIEGWVPIRAVLGHMPDASPPDQLQSKSKAVTKPTAASHQCEALTTKGTRCKRNAVSGSRYCWQHQNYKP